MEWAKQCMKIRVEILFYKKFSDLYLNYFEIILNKYFFLWNKQTKLNAVILPNTKFEMPAHQAHRRQISI